MTKLPNDDHGMGIPTDPRRKTPHQERVEAFMFKAGQEVPNHPTMPDEKTRILRAKLVFEEAVRELIMIGLGMSIRLPGCLGAIIDSETTVEFVPTSEPNLKEIADGCADTSVVTIGTLSACGITDVELLEEVDRSNLAKFGPGGHKREDGKWMKPSDWKAPDIEGVLARQMPKKPVKAAWDLGDARLVVEQHIQTLRRTDYNTVADAIEALLPKLEKLDSPPQYNSGGMTLCPNCRNPLSDEMVKDLKKGKRDKGGCPECQVVFTLADLSAPKVH